MDCVTLCLQGNTTRFMNHDSREPNVSAVIINHRGTRRVVFHAAQVREYITGM